MTVVEPGRLALPRKAARTGWTRWVPALQIVRSYDPSWLRHDIVAGLVLIPIEEAEGAAIAAVIADVAYTGSLFLAIRGLPGKPTPVHRSFLLRLAAAGGAAVLVGLALPASDAVVAAVAAIVFAGACIALRMVPVDVWSAIPRPGRA